MRQWQPAGSDRRDSAGNPLFGPQTFEEAQTAVSDTIQKWRTTLLPDHDEYEDAAGVVHPASTGRTLEQASVYRGWAERGEGRAFWEAWEGNEVLAEVQQARQDNEGEYTIMYSNIPGQEAKEIKCKNLEYTALTPVTDEERARAEVESDYEYETRASFLDDLPEGWYRPWGHTVAMQAAGRRALALNILNRPGCCRRHDDAAKAGNYNGNCRGGITLVTRLPSGEAGQAALRAADAEVGVTRAAVEDGATSDNDEDQQPAAAAAAPRDPEEGNDYSSDEEEDDETMFAPPSAALRRRQRRR